MEKDNVQNNQPDEEIQVETVIDERVWNLITGMYDETFKELVER